MTVLTMLDLSTGHITEEDSTKLYILKELATLRNSPIRIIAHQYGWFVNVPEDKSVQERIERVIALIDAGFSEEFIVLYFMARDSGCSWINFDQDGETVDDLPVFDW